MFGSCEANTALEDIASVVSGKSIPTNLEDITGTLAYIKVSDFNVKGNEKLITTSSRFVTEENGKLSKKIPVGSIIFAKNGAASLSNKKRLTDIECCIDMNTMAIIPRKELILAEYLYSVISAIDLSAFVRHGAIPSMSPKSIESIKLHIPTIDEQKRLVVINQQADKSKSINFS